MNPAEKQQLQAAQQLKESSSKLLAQFQNRKFLTCAGMETYLCFQQNFDLPEFCAFVVFDHPEEMIKFETNHMSKVLAAAAFSGHGLLVDIMVWRASPDYLKLLGRDPGQEELQRIHKKAIDRTRNYVNQWRKENGYTAVSFPVLIVADIGPRGDGYKVENPSATSDSFRKYHSEQLKAITAVGGVDLVTAYTITSVEESIGISQACSDAGLPHILSATVETDGRLPDGSEVKTLVEKTDATTSDVSPLFYCVNCAHPTHLSPALDKALDNDEEWLARFRGFRANASCKSHEELDNSTELDRGDAVALAASLVEMRDKFGLYILGGCCGTDHEHIAKIAAA